jgi:dTDP-4-dehydrorhamnose 3,5-epimerase
LGDNPDVEHAQTSIPGLLTFTPVPVRDERGFFCRTFDPDAARSAGLEPEAFLQDSLSRSTYGVVRGLHVRTGAGESKLVRCSSGRIFDVVVDLRPSSPSYLRWLAFELDGNRQNSVYIPSGCAHGFQVLSQVADTSYRIDRVHDPSEDLTIAWNDPELGIPWPLPVTVMSAKDAAAPRMSELGERLTEIRASP